jgi:hypothetical protein
MISILTVLELIKDSNTEEGQKPFSIRWIKTNGEIGNKPKVVQHKKALNPNIYRHKKAKAATPNHPAMPSTSKKQGCSC